MTARVIAVARDASHNFSKNLCDEIVLLSGLGVEGDAHQGVTVKHRSRVARDPSQVNLRQVHLMHGEFHDEVNAAGFAVKSGDLGENITTRGLDLLGLPRGTRLMIGDSAIVEVTGLRNPCVQIDRFQTGLTAACLGKDEKGALIRKAGVMSVVIAGGPVRAGDTIRVELPAGTLLPLEVV